MYNKHYVIINNILKKFGGMVKKVTITRFMTTILTLCTVT